jgi:26S proteasome regulatory subunit T3
MTELEGRSLYEEVKKQQYLKAQILQRIQYHRDEYKQLKVEILHAEEELKRIKATPLTINQFAEMVDTDYGIIANTYGTGHYVRVMSTIDRELLKPNSSGFSLFLF